MAELRGRLGFSLLIVLILTFMLQIPTPVQGHYTLGDSQPTHPYRSGDVEPNHVAGPMGYVWPGAGLSMYLNQPQPWVPGYQSPTTSPLLQGNYYSPWASILTSTPERQNVGDLIFAVNFTKHPEWPEIDYKYNDIVIYIPPEFRLLQSKDSVSTTITNHYGDITVGSADSLDPFAPNWSYIKVSGTLSFLVKHGYREWYYVRVNAVAAPTIAGRYVFKIFLNQTYPNRSGPMYYTMPVENYPVLLVKGEVDPAIITGVVKYGAWNQPLYNLPLKLPGRVRAVGVAEDPYTGKPTGRLVEARGYFNASSNGYFEVEGLAPGVYDLYASAAGYPEEKVASNIRLLRGKSLHLEVYLNPGAVVHGTIYSKHGYGESPWQGQRPVRVEIYNAPQREVRQPINEAALVSWSPINQTHTPYTSYVLGNTIWSMGAVPPTPKLAAFPWEGPSPSKDLNGVYNGVGPAQYWWVDPYGQYTNGGGATGFNFQFGLEGRYGAPTEFDGHVPQVFATWINGLTPGTYYVRAWINGYVQADASGVFAEYSFTVPEGKWPGDVYVAMDLRVGGWINKTVHFHDFLGAKIDQPIKGPDPGRYLIAEARDPQGHLAAFNFTYVHARNSSCTITLNGLGMAGPNLYPLNGGAGDQGMKYFLYRYRRIRDYGITPGTYIIRVYMRGYLQVSLENVTVSLSGGQVQVSNHMYRGAGVNITLYSVDWEKPQVERPWTWPGKTITLTVYDEGGASLGSVKYWSGTAWSDLKQSLGQTTLPHPNWNPSYSKLKFNGSLTLEVDGPAKALKASPYYPDALTATGWTPYLEAGFIKSESTYKRADHTSKMALKTGAYTVKAYTYGYIQREVPTVYATMGGQADTSLKLTLGLNLTITIIFKCEGLISPPAYNMSARIRVYNEENQLVAASTTSYPANPFHYLNGVLSNHPSFTGEAVNHVPAGTQVLTWLVAGLYDYSDPVKAVNATYGLAGAPDYMGNWTLEVGFVNWYRSNAWYPPPPALLSGEYNLGKLLYAYNHLGPYEVKQTITIPTVHLGGEASIQIQVDLRGLIRGVVSGYTWSDELRTLSWATVKAQGETGEYIVYTLDGLYESYLPPGFYNLTVYEWTLEGQGHSPYSSCIAVAEGQEAEGVNIILKASSIPIPELNPKIQALTLAASAAIIRWRRRTNRLKG